MQFCGRSVFFTGMFHYKVVDIHGGVNTAVGGEELRADLIDINGVLQTNVLIAREAFTSSTFAMDLYGFGPMRAIGWTVQLGAGPGPDYAVEALRSPEGIVVPVHFENGNPYVFLDIKPPASPVPLLSPLHSAAPVPFPSLYGGAASLGAESSC